MAIVGKHKYWRINIVSMRAGYSYHYPWNPMIFKDFMQAKAYDYSLWYLVSPEFYNNLAVTQEGDAGVSASTNATDAAVIAFWAKADNDLYREVGNTVSSEVSIWFKLSFTNAVELPVWYLKDWVNYIGSANIEYSDNDSSWTVLKTFTYTDYSQHVPLYVADYPVKVSLGGSNAVIKAVSALFTLGGRNATRTTRFPLILGGSHEFVAPPKSDFVPSLSNLELRYSGGASNSSPAASLGGVMSSYECAGQIYTGTAIPGVTILRGSDNLIGKAKLKVFALSDGSIWMQWWPSGISGTGAVAIEGDGYYTLPTYGGTETGYLCVDVAYADLVLGEYEVWVDFKKNAVFTDVTSQQSNSGLVSYRCLYLYNSHQNASAFDLALYLKRDTLNLSSSIAIGLDPAGVGGTATSIVNETTAPAGVSFTTPSKSSPLAVGLLRFDLAVPLWIRRTVLAGNPVQDRDETSLLGFFARFV